MPAATTVTLDAKRLAEISARLSERADQIQQITLRDLNLDLRLAAQVCDRLAHLQAEISEIAGKCTDADAARELRDAIDDVKRGA